MDKVVCRIEREVHVNRYKCIVLYCIVSRMKHRQVRGYKQYQINNLSTNF